MKNRIDNINQSSLTAGGVERDTTKNDALNNEIVDKLNIGLMNTILSTMKQNIKSGRFDAGI